MLKDIYEIKLSRNDLDVSCYVGSQGTVMRFDKRDVAKRSLMLNWGIDNVWRNKKIF